MDIISHALLTNLVFKEAPLYQRVLATIFGILPDIVSFGGMYNVTFLKRILFFKKPPHTLFPSYVMKLYLICHSLIVWVAVFLVLWAAGLEWLAIAFCGWALHIVIDIFTHSREAFPTKIFWPLSNFHFSGVSWSNKWFIFGSYFVIVVLYLIFYF